MRSGGSYARANTPSLQTMHHYPKQQTKTQSPKTVIWGVYPRPPPPVGGLNRVYLEAETRVFRLTNASPREYSWKLRVVFLCGRYKGKGIRK